MFSLLLMCSLGYSQDAIHNVCDTIAKRDTTIKQLHVNGVINKTLTTRSFIIPVVFAGYGLVALNSHPLITLNHNTAIEITEDNAHFLTGADNLMQIVPGVAVYELNALGVHGKHNFRDRSIIYATANIISASIVFPMKKLTHEERPDHSSFKSFPSGHTATAFAAAEFLRQEYRGVSAWYGIAGYTMATATGILRMYNNKHWLSDVVTGAGFGIMATKLAYIIYPAIQKKLFKIQNSNALLLPYYQNGHQGLAFMYLFNH